MRHIWEQRNFQPILGVTKLTGFGTARTVCKRCGVVLRVFTSMKCKGGTTTNEGDPWYSKNAGVVHEPVRAWKRANG